MSINWEIHGWAFGNCSCDYGCPCQFEARPTHGYCRGTGFFNIETGFFGDTSLDRTKMGAIYAWPGPIHEGKGRCQPIIDPTADDAQREALNTIFHGGEADPFSNVFTVYSAMCDEVYDPIFTEISFEMDIGERTARCVAKGLVESGGDPIIGATGHKHRAQIFLPDGVEYRVAEMGRGRCTVEGDMAMRLDDGYAQFTELHMNRHGVMR